MSQQFAFKSIGKNVRIDPTALFFNPENISIGDNVRIDAHVVISAGTEQGVTIGDHVHIACGCYLFGAGGIILEDFSGLSGRVMIYSATDDYSGESLTNPTVPDEYTNVHKALVTLKKHVIIGAGTVILPGVTFGTGSACAAMSLVKKPVADFTIVAGYPAKPIGTRSNKLLDLEQQFLGSAKAQAVC